MRIFLLGATGKTGAIFLKMALENGHHVTAYVRSPEKITGVYGNSEMGNLNVNPSPHSNPHQQLRIVVGEILSVEQMSEAMKNHDVVVSCLGGNDNDKTTVIRDMTQAIVASMQKSHVTRILAISSAGIHNEFSPITNLILKLFYKHVIQDHRLAAQCIMTSGLSYTLARPLSLTEGSLTKSFRLASRGVPKGGKEISRQDLAHFLLTALEGDDYHNETVGLAY